jgi:uncharacterized membrane protein
MTQYCNVGIQERWLSIGSGALLTMLGVRRGATLPGLLIALGGGYLIYRGNSGRCLMYRSLGINEQPEPAIEAVGQVTIAGTRDEVYNFCKDIGYWSEFSGYVTQVSSTGPGRFRCGIRLLGDLTVSVDGAIVEDVPGRSITWHLHSTQSLREDEVVCREVLSDTADAQGTDLHVRLEVRPPGGLLGVTVGRWFQSTLRNCLEDDLRRFKRMLEAGQPTWRQREAGTEVATESAAAAAVASWEPGAAQD